MDLQDATGKLGQILDEERKFPTLRYAVVTVADPVLNVTKAFDGVRLLSGRGPHPRPIHESPEDFVLKSTNFDLLCALFDQVSVQDRPSLFQALVSRINRRECYRDKSGEILRAGQWRQYSSELPLVAEFAVRRGDKAIFFGALRKPALSPGLTLLLVQLEEMIALNFTLFTDEEYIELSDAVESIRVEVSKLPKQAPSGSSADTNTYHHVRREIPTLCESLIEGSRKARFLYSAEIAVSQ